MISPYIPSFLNEYVHYKCYKHLLVGGIPTPLKNDGVRQLGWWHSQYMEKKMFQTTSRKKLGTSEDIGMLPQTDIRISMMTWDIGKLGIL